MQIILNDEMHAQIKAAGQLRTEESVKSGYADINPRSALANEVAELGRFAFCNFMGLSYSFSHADKRLQRDGSKINNFYVRTRSKHSYDLTIDPRDLPNDKIALLTCEDGRTVKIHGWITAKEGRDIGTTRYFPSTNTTVYLVSKEQLHPFEETQNEAR